MPKTNKQQAPKQVEELKDEQLDQANGGIIAILIGLKDPKKPAGSDPVLADGSVRPIG